LIRSRRIQFRAGLEYPPDPCLDIVATLEIIDNFTGRTMVLYAPKNSMTATGEHAN